MKGLVGWLVRWGLGDLDARVLLSELEEERDRKARAESPEAAARWLREETRRAAFAALAYRIRRGRGGVGRASTAAGALPIRGRGTGGFAGDIRFGVRILRKRPLFSVLVMGTLGLGIGASTVVFSLVDGVLIRDLEFSEPGELVNLWKTYPGWRGQEVVGEAWDKLALKWEEYQELKGDSELFRDLGIHRARTMTLRSLGRPEEVVVGEANPALFPTLGVGFTLGRGFAEGEEGPESPRVAVLSHSFWASRYGSDRDVIGSSVELDEETFEIIGVLAQDVRLPSTIFGLLNSGLDGGEKPLWVPLQFDRIDGSQDNEAILRVPPGVTMDQVRTEFEGIVRNGRSEDQLGFRYTRPKEEIVRGHRSALHFLMAGSLLLLLIACVNTAALLMSEAVGRRQEMATRMALGAGRARVTRQLLTESTLLGLAGAGLGILLALAGIRGFLALAPPLPRLEEVGINPTVLLFSILAGLATGILFGLVPALSVRSGSLRSSQVSGGRGVAGGGSGFQRALLAMELGMTMILVVSGGLLVRSLVRLTEVDPGFDATSVATVRVSLPRPRARDYEANRLFFTRLVERIREVPGVVTAGGVDGLPFPGRITGSELRIPGEGDEVTSLISRHHTVLPGYLETMNIDLVMGRTFTDSDLTDDGGPRLVVNELLYRRYWPDSSPLGDRVVLSGVEYEVVGVVGDVVERHLAEEPKPMAYVVRPEVPGSLTLVARGRGRPEDLGREMGGVIRSLEPDATLTQESTLPSLVASSTAAEGFRTALTLAFGILATLLTAVGVFGVTAHVVSRRRREMGIRLALGAEGGSLVRGMIADFLVPGISGIALGVLGATAVSRILGGYLFGIEATDPPTYLVAAVTVAALSTLAAAVPATRAGRVDPVQVLREE